MARRSSIEDGLARLHALRADAGSAQARAELVAALGGRGNILAAKAAGIVAAAGQTDLGPQLEEAFGRFMAGAAADRGCLAKTAIAKALYELGTPADGVFLRGIRHVQLEPAIGGQVDTAAELRGLCALGLVRMGHRDCLLELTDLLMDGQMQARILAARALAYAGRPEGALLLRLKLLAGDKEVDVLAECMAALVKLAPDASLGFIARFLASADPALAEAAALALADSHSPAAFELLLAHWKKPLVFRQRRPIVAAMGLLRLPQSLEFLLSLLAEGDDSAATAAIAALAVYRHDPQVRERVEAAVRGRGEPGLLEQFGRT